MTHPSSTSRPAIRASRIRTEFNPDGDDVELKSGKKGHVVRVTAFWPALRCWDVHVFDPDHDGDPPLGFDMHRDRNVRGAQVRGMKLGGAPWKEVRV